MRGWHNEADWIGLAAGVTAKLKRGAMDGTANEAGKAPVPRHMYDGVFSNADRAERISDTQVAVAMTRRRSRPKAKQQGMLRMR